MKSTLFTVATATTLSILSAAAPAQDGPPGMIRVKGDRYEIGADTKEIKALIEETLFTPLASETPKHSVKLDDFFIMPTEVTNEQFARFVAATSSEPPQGWGADAIGAAGLEYATRTGKARKEAKDAGEPLPEFEPFDRSLWWKRNWQDSEWQIPKGQEAMPVVFINYSQAEGYARWAGLRLMSEQEFQAAGRGKSDRKYTWGNEPNPKNTNCMDTRLGGPAKVGSYPAGTVWVDAKGRVVDAGKAKDASGVYDLCGNVWEGTRSPFKAYPGFKPLEVKLPSNKKKERVTPSFDGDHRTAVSGGFNSPVLTTRLTTRRNTSRDQATDGLGMRCSASAIPALDIAQSILRMDLPVSKRPDDTTYFPDRITAVDRWVSSEGSKPVPEYRVIESYDFVAFIPVDKIAVNSTLTLKTDSRRKGPIEIGAFSTTLPLVVPALEPGTYTLSWRSAGKFENTGGADEGADTNSTASNQDGEDAAEAVEEAPEFPFDPMRDTLLFRNTSGELVGWIEVRSPDEARLGPGRVAVTELDAVKAEQLGKQPGTVLTFKVMPPSKKPNKGFTFSIPITVAPGAVDDTWRK